MPPVVQPLDLVDVALLLNYERATTEPRFKNTKLVQVTRPGEEPSYRFTRNPHIKDARAAMTIELSKQPESETQDLPSNMLAANPSQQLSALTPKELETIFYQIRGHDGCYITIALLQHFFDHFPNDTPLQIRHRPTQKKRGASLSNGDLYTTQIDKRMILEMQLVNPKLYQCTVISPDNSTYVSGEEEAMDHAVFGFAPLESEFTTSFLDLSSMQFGDLGRGFGDPKRGGGKALVVLDTSDEYELRMARVADVDPNKSNTKISTRIGVTPHDEWLKRVASRAKGRWDRREEEKWCSHCGAPVPITTRCSGCKAAWFCGKEHQEMAWAFHKGYCVQQEA
jgi:hypothetical protein